MVLDRGSDGNCLIARLPSLCVGSFMGSTGRSRLRFICMEKLCKERTADTTVMFAIDSGEGRYYATVVDVKVGWIVPPDATGSCWTLPVNRRSCLSCPGIIPEVLVLIIIACHNQLGDGVSQGWANCDYVSMFHISHSLTISPLFEACPCSGRTNRCQEVLESKCQDRLSNEDFLLSIIL